MGKNGVALRAAKADNVTYTFTRAQLEAHDQLVRGNCQDLLLEQMEKIKKEKNKEIDLYLQLDTHVIIFLSKITKTLEEKKYF